VAGYELAVEDDAARTWYTAARGTMAAGDGEQTIDFPQVEGARSVVLSVSGVHGGGDRFAASEVHFVYGGGGVSVDPVLEASAPPPAGNGAATVGVDVSANVPYDVSIEGGAGWVERRIADERAGRLAFALKANAGGERSATVVLRGRGQRGAGIERRIAIVQRAKTEEGGGESGTPLGTAVKALSAVCFDRAMKTSDAATLIDGRLDTFHSVAAGSADSYEFRFAEATRLSSIVYYPRQSATDHGTLARVAIDVTVRAGGTGVGGFVVDIPASVFADPASRRKGWRIDLPVCAANVAIVSVSLKSGHQTSLTTAEMEFYVAD
jgi:hypothetical protein